MHSLSKEERSPYRESHNAKELHAVVGKWCARQAVHCKGMFAGFQASTSEDIQSQTCRFG
jgi:hypothetical protein